MRKIMACLDAGTDTLKLVVGEIVNKKLNVLAISETPAKGLKNSLIEDEKAVVESLKDLIKNCEEMIGLKISQMILAIPSNNAKYSVIEGTIKIENDGYLISGNDIKRVIQKAIKQNIIENYEYINFIPTSFSLDDERVIKDPKGLTSKSLKVRGVLSSTPKKNLYPIVSCLESLGINIVDVCLGIIGDYYEFKDKELDKSVGAVINLGCDTTTIGIFNNGVITNSTTLASGGKSVDNDISFVYKISPIDSKKLKETFASSSHNMAQDSDIIEVDNKLSQKTTINQLEVTDIVESRLKELLNLCKKEINNLTKKEISYIIITGGLTEVKDFIILVEETFAGVASLGTIHEIGARNNKYSTCLGVIKYYAQDARLKDKDFSIFSIEEQQLLSGNSLDSQNENVLNKLFGYIFNN